MAVICVCVHAHVCYNAIPVILFLQLTGDSKSQSATTRSTLRSTEVCTLIEDKISVYHCVVAFVESIILLWQITMYSPYNTYYNLSTDTYMEYILDINPTFSIYTIIYNIIERIIHNT